MRKLTAVKYAVSASVLALAVVACTKQEQQPAEEEVKVAEPVVQEIQAVCDEPSLRNRLVDSLQAGLLDNALLAVQGYDDAARLGLEQQVRQKLTEVNIDLQNVAASGATCHADVQFTLPAQTISAANQAYQEAGQTALDEQAADAGAALVGGNRLVAKNFAYTIEDNRAVIGNDNAIISLVANTVVTAAHSMAGESRSNAENAPAVRLEPVAPIPAPRVQTREEDAPPTPQIRERQQTAPTPRPAPAERSEAQPQRPQTQPQTQPRTETNTRQNQTQTQPQPQPQRSQTPAQPRPQAQAPAHKPVADEDIELTIVEGDDTY